MATTEQQPPATRQGEHTGTSHKGDGAWDPGKSRNNDINGDSSQVSGGGGQRDRHHTHDPATKS